LIEDVTVEDHRLWWHALESWNFSWLEMLYLNWARVKVAKVGLSVNLILVVFT